MLRASTVQALRTLATIEPSSATSSHFNSSPWYSFSARTIVSGITPTVLSESARTLYTLEDIPPLRRGRLGVRGNDRASLPVFTLWHLLQSSCKFSNEFVPPANNGTTWSTSRAFGEAQTLHLSPNREMSIPAALSRINGRSSLGGFSRDIPVRTLALGTNSRSDAAFDSCFLGHPDMAATLALVCVYLNRGHATLSHTSTVYERPSIYLSLYTLVVSLIYSSVYYSEVSDLATMMLQTSAQRETCPRCGIKCDCAKDSLHSEHAHFIGASDSEHRWTNA